MRITHSIGRRPLSKIDWNCWDTTKYSTLRQAARTSRAASLPSAECDTDGGYGTCSSADGINRHRSEIPVALGSHRGQERREGRSRDAGCGNEREEPGAPPPGSEDKAPREGLTLVIPGFLKSERAQSKTGARKLTPRKPRPTTAARPLRRVHSAFHAPRSIEDERIARNAQAPSLDQLAVRSPPVRGPRFQTETFTLT